MASESYLVLAVGSLGGYSLKVGRFPFPAPHCLEERSLSLGEPLSSVGKLQRGWKEKINSGCLGFLARPD